MKASFINYLGEYISVMRPESRKRIRNDSGNLILLLCCDYLCSAAECVKNISFACKYPEIPLIVLRKLPLRLNAWNRPIFSLSVYKEYSYSSGQLHILEGLRSSDCYFDNVKANIHPTTPIHKITNLQHEIAESFGEQFDLRRSAAVTGFSPGWTSRKFSEYANIDLHKYIMQNKYCYGLWQIMGTNRSIKEIAFSLGYTQSAFCRRFRTLFKTEPSALRRTMSVNDIPLENTLELEMRQKKSSKSKKG